MTSELAYVLAAEKIGQIEVPKRAQYLRVIAAELQRIASHCLWLGTWCMDMGGALGGGATVFLYCFRERETLLDLFEALTGARLLYGFHQVGGTRYDLPAGWAERCRSTVDLIERRIDEYEAMLEGNPFFLARTRGVGVISRELAQEVGVSGPLIRGSGVAYDIRRAEPYSSYEAFDFKVPVETEGDCWARYRVRMVEFRESIGIVRQALEGLPPGPISSRPGVKSVGQVRIGKGETYARVEGPRGEVGCYLVADGSAKPYRMKWRGASFSNLSVLPHIVPGHKVADVAPGLGCADLNVALLFFLAVSALEIVGLFMGGWGSNNKYALLSAMRAVNQIISYDLPFIFAALIPVVLSGTLRLGGIVEAQQGGWYVAYPVIGQLGFLAYLIAMLAAENRVPFDILEAESELVAGFRVEYSGMKFALIQLAEYAHVIATSYLGALLFLGGWLGPGPAWLGAVWFTLKALLLFLLVTWVRWTFVRIRVDQILGISWKLLLPATLALLLLAAFVVA